MNYTETNEFKLNLNPLIIPLYRKTKPIKLNLKYDEAQRNGQSQHQLIKEKQQKEEEAMLKQKQKQIDQNRKDIEMINKKKKSESNINSEEAQKSIKTFISRKLQKRYRNLIRGQNEEEQMKIAKLFADKIIEQVTKEIKQENRKKKLDENKFDKQISGPIIEQFIQDVIKGNRSLVKDAAANQWTEISEYEIEQRSRLN